MQSAEDRARVALAVARCQADLDALQFTVVGSLGARLDALARLATRERLPRVTVIGRRGAGKSSLLNALCNAERAPTGAVEDTTGGPRCYEVSLDSRVIQWIDTGGLRAGGAARARAELLCETLVNEPPDVLVFAHHASETDAAIDADLEDVAAALDAVKVAHGRRPPMIALATRVDELDPPDVFVPPFDDETKRKNISAAVRALRRALQRHKLAVVDAFAINTWFSATDDLRWNIDVFRASLARHLATASPAAHDELRALLYRVADALATVVLRARSTPRALTDEWFVSTLRRLGPVAARAGDRGEAAAKPTLLSAPSHWLSTSLARSGARSIADAVALRSLRALGHRVVDAAFDEP
jgi:predicted GTPase